jgi:Fic family protein
MTTVKEKIQLLIQLSGKTQESLARDLNVSFPTLNSWINERSVPRKGSLQKIHLLLADFGVTYETPKNTVLDQKSAAIAALSLKNPNPLQKILSRTDLIDELSLQITYNTNALEGSTLTIEDTANVLFHNIILKNKTLNEQLEAKNHDRAFRTVITDLSDENTVIDELFAKKIHSILMGGIRQDAGQYRIHPARILGSYVPTANPLKIPQLMKELFEIKKSKEIMRTASMFHADFEKIHPFADGNGRTGRLLLIATLLQHSYAPAIIAKKYRPQYHKALQEAQINENYAAIEEFVIDAIIEGYRVIND